MFRSISVAMVFVLLFAVGARASDSDQRDAKVKGMMVSAFLAECRTSVAECTADASAVEGVLSLEAIGKLLSKEAVNGDYCEPADMTDEQRRQVLVNYFVGHPAMASMPLTDAARSAFSQTWAGVCEDQSRAHAAMVAELERLTVGQYMAGCQTDLKTCDNRTAKAADEVNERSLARLINGDKSNGFCYPDMETPGIRQALIGYFGRTPSVSSRPFLDSSEAAFVSLWPDHGQC